MKALKERIKSSETLMPVATEPVDEKIGAGVASAPRVPAIDYQSLKSRLHRSLISKLDLTRLNIVQRDVLRHEITRLVEDLLDSEAIPLSSAERERIVTEVANEIFGLGPLEPLLQDRTISDILVNRYNRVYIERHGKIERIDVTFKDDQHLLQIIDRIVSGVGRRIDESSPMVDARLPDGSRVNAILPPLAIDGPVLSIRRFGTIQIAMDELIRKGTATPALAFLLEGCVKARLNIVVSGGTGAGKTTLLNVLSSYIPEDERIVTIEDSAELQLQQEHVVRLETRPPNIEGRGQVTQRDLVCNALRMRPDRIVVGEVRGGEAIDMLQAMNTGHDGSLTTVHANSPRDAVARIETMMSMGGLNLSDRAMRAQIVSAVNLVVHLSRLSDGTRKIVSVSEITGMEGEIVTMQDIFLFERLGVDREGHVLGQTHPTGIRPKFAERLARYGYRLDSSLFDFALESAGGP
jgi:pilus assembly protein CpaF